MHWPYWFKQETIIVSLIILLSCPFIFINYVNNNDIYWSNEQRPCHWLYLSIMIYLVSGFGGWGWGLPGGTSALRAGLFVRVTDLYSSYLFALIASIWIYYIYSHLLYPFVFIISICIYWRYMYSLYIFVFIISIYTYHIYLCLLIWGYL